MANMLKILPAAALAATIILSATGCGKEGTVPKAKFEKEYLESWLKVNGYNTTPTGRGIYIIDDIPGDGRVYNGQDYIKVEYTLTDLEGNIQSTTDEQKAKQIGTYSEASYFGPRTWAAGNGLTVGLIDMVADMKEGGRRTALIPSWLSTYEEYKTPEDYIKNDNGAGTSSIYTIELTEVIDDLEKYQIQQIENYFIQNFDEHADSTGLGYGMYYHRLRDPLDDTREMPGDTIAYINYTGFLLDGMIFDTTDEKTAKDNHIYSKSRTYQQVKINYAERYADITMGAGDSESSAPVTGFQRLLKHMKNKEKGIGVFISDLGYGSAGKGLVPGYSVMAFEVEIVDAP